MKLTYCTRCLYPSTKPDLHINSEGVCSACINFENRANIDWNRRKEDFIKLVDYIKSMKLQYDCIVPVSGGKDSTYQILKCLEYGLNPLAVTATTDHLTDIGRQNLDNISKLGVDHIEVTTNMKLRKKLNAYCLREIGDISWPEHQTIFSIPVNIALKFNIPLLIYGENPQNEYGSPTDLSAKETKLTNRWLNEFGGLNGLRVSDIINKGIATEREMYIYKYPNLESKTTNAIFLGQYFAWDGLENVIAASKHGFKEWHGAIPGIGYSYENLDNAQVTIHDRFKYIKYGYGRATDLVCNHIRRKRITREEGKEIILMYDNYFPREYLGVSLEEILEPLKITIEEYIQIEDRFLNKELFERLRSNKLKPLFLEDLRNA